MVIEAIGQTTAAPSSSQANGGTFGATAGWPSGSNTLNGGVDIARVDSKSSFGSPIANAASAVSMQTVGATPELKHATKTSQATPIPSGRKVDAGGNGIRGSPVACKSPAGMRASADHDLASDPESHHDEHEDEATEALLHGMVIPIGRKVDWRVAILVFCCLAFHSFVAGVALGLSGSGEEVTDVVVAIVAHKGLAATALSTALLRAGVSWTVFVRLALLFSTVTPAGVGLGLLAEGLLTGAEDSPVTAAVLAFAAGTFLQVGLVEMIVHEVHDAHNKVHDAPRSTGTLQRHERRRAALSNCSALCTETVSGLLIAFGGFTLMSVLAVWV